MRPRFLQFFFSVILLVAGLLFLSASPAPAFAASKLKVVTATTDMAALAQEVGGDRVEVDSIARGYQDSHFVEAKPSFLLLLRRADLLVVVGLQLEIGWLPPLINQSGNPRIQVGAPGYLDASQFAEILEKNWPKEEILVDPEIDTDFRAEVDKRTVKPDPALFERAERLLGRPDLLRAVPSNPGFQAHGRLATQRGGG
jgi:ABC-type Zn uptake system ZnuABC Zn-binding protein ZnuA